MNTPRSEIVNQMRLLSCETFDLVSNHTNERIPCALRTPFCRLNHANPMESRRIVLDFISAELQDATLHFNVLVVCNSMSYKSWLSIAARHYAHLQCDFVSCAPLTPPNGDNATIFVLKSAHLFKYFKHLTFEHIFFDQTAPRLCCGTVLSSSLAKCFWLVLNNKSYSQHVVFSHMSALLVEKCSDSLLTRQARNLSANVGFKFFRFMPSNVSFEAIQPIMENFSSTQLGRMYEHVWNLANRGQQNLAAAFVRELPQADNPFKEMNNRFIKYLHGKSLIATQLSIRLVSLAEMADECVSCKTHFVAGTVWRMFMPCCFSFNVCNECFVGNKYCCCRMYNKQDVFKLLNGTLSPCEWGVPFFERRIIYFKIGLSNLLANCSFAKTVILYERKLEASLLHVDGDATSEFNIPNVIYDTIPFKDMIVFMRRFNKASVAHFQHDDEKKILIASTACLLKRSLDLGFVTTLIVVVESTKSWRTCVGDPAKREKLLRMFATTGRRDKLDVFFLIDDWARMYKVNGRTIALDLDNREDRRLWLSN